MNVSEKLLALSSVMVVGLLGLALVTKIEETPSVTGGGTLPNVVVAPSVNYVNEQGQRCLVWEMPERVFYYQCEGGQQGLYQIDLLTPQPGSYEPEESNTVEG